LCAARCPQGLQPYVLLPRVSTTWIG
jgi:hypothetical protein